MTTTTNLGWLDEPAPDRDRQHLGWVTPPRVSRETESPGHDSLDGGAAETGESTTEMPVQASPAGWPTSDAQPGDPGQAAEDHGAAGIGPVETPDEAPMEASMEGPDVAGTRVREVLGEEAVEVEATIEIAETTETHEGLEVGPDGVPYGGSDVGDDNGRLDAAPTPEEGDVEAPRTPRAILAAGISRSVNGAEAPAASVEHPVDNNVDVHAESARSVREADLPGLGDNTVDEGLDLAPVSRETLERDELAAAIPTAGEDTPLARELADNARRRIQLIGRDFPKPLIPRVLTVANQKGGVGKTTTTVNIAAAMAQAGLKVLVIDLDPQGNASTALGIDHHAEVPSIYDVLVEGAPLLDVVQPCTTVEGLYCAPATIDLAGAEIELVSLVARESRLHKAIAAAEVTGHAFDYILIDCPPSLGLLTVNAMVAASEVFIPIQCEYYALEGLSQLLKNIELIRAHLNPPLHVSTILLTMYDGRTRLSAQVADEVREHFPKEVLRTTVPRSVRVSEAPSFGETVMTYDAASSGALAYLEAAGEIADRGAGITG